MNTNQIKTLSVQEIATLLNVGEFNPIGMLRDKLCWKINGNASRLLKKDRPPIVAIIGTRDIGVQQSTMVREIVKKLKANESQPIILSGLAVGTETSAHRAALEYGLPTYAVLPCGLDTIYPAANRRLAKEMIDNGGGLISTFEDGTAPMPINILERYKVLVMISDLIIIPYSKHKGGAIVAAKTAMDFDTPVLALPGDVDNVRSQGCNHLIKEGYAEILDNLEDLKAIELKIH